MGPVPAVTCWSEALNTSVPRRGRNGNFPERAGECSPPPPPHPSGPHRGRVRHHAGRPDGQAPEVHHRQRVVRLQPGGEPRPAPGPRPSTPTPASAPTGKALNLTQESTVPAHNPGNPGLKADSGTEPPPGTEFSGFSENLMSRATHSPGATPEDTHARLQPSRNLHLGIHRVEDDHQHWAGDRKP